DRDRADGLPPGALRSRLNRRCSWAERPGVGRRPSGDRADAAGKRCQQRKSRSSIFRHHSSVGGRQGACLAATGSWAASSRRRAHAELRCLKTAPLLGLAPRRSALRENRRLARAEMIVAADATKEIQFEIGHVLFIDIVGYSKLLINEQSEQIHTLRKIVRGTEQFRLAEAQGKLVRLPTGDGGALVFRNIPEAPVLCALEITKELQKDTGSKEKPHLRLRMGIHSGPVNEVVDLNEQ